MLIFAQTRLCTARVVARIVATCIVGHDGVESRSSGRAGLAWSRNYGEGGHRRRRGWLKRVAKGATLPPPFDLLALTRPKMPQPRPIVPRCPLPTSTHIGQDSILGVLAGLELSRSASPRNGGREDGSARGTHPTRARCGSRSCLRSIGGCRSAHGHGSDWLDASCALGTLSV